MRIVADTNVLLSSLGWMGPEHALMKMVFEGYVTLCLSPDILEEFKIVSRRKKFGFGEDEIDEFLTALIEGCDIVLPDMKINVILEDPKDNMILECALEAGADTIVTGDRHLLDLGEFKGIGIVNASAFLTDLRKRQRDGSTL